MNFLRVAPPHRHHADERGSVLIIVLWVAFGLVTLALYFANSMGLELRASDNRIAALEADQAIAGATLYASNILATLETPGTVPEVKSYHSEDVPVGDARFWFIGRDDRQNGGTQVAWGLVDESSRLNVNTATAAMLALLPGMTADLAAAIIDWRDSNSEPSASGAEDEMYLRLNPARHCKNAPFDTVDELHLVYGLTYEVLYGEDANRNGLLDPNENDGDTSLPLDNRDGRLNPGIWEYLTVYSREPSGSRTNVNNQQQLAPLLQERFGATRANQILSRLGTGGGGGGQTNQNQFSNLLQFYVRSGMTEDEFGQVYSSLTTTNGGDIIGLVNVNTAPEAVLACIPGIGTEKAPSLVSFRQSNAGTRLDSLAWVMQVLDQTSALQAGPYLTARSYQFSADVAALGHQDRGFRRVRSVLDASTGMPRVVFRQDLTHLGWALGRDTLRDLQQNRDTRAVASTRTPTLPTTR